MGGAGADLLPKNCARVKTWPSIGKWAACFRLEVSIGPMAHQQVGLRRRAEGGGIFLGGDGDVTLSKNCAQIETWPSIGNEAACFRLKIAIGPIAHQLLGLRQRAEGGGIFLGGAGAGLLSKNCPQRETRPSIGLGAGCFRLKIAIGPIAHQLVGLRRRAEGGGHFLGRRWR